MKPFGSRRTYAKCIVLKACAGKARQFNLTMKNRKTERQEGKDLYKELTS